MVKRLMLVLGVLMLALPGVSGVQAAAPHAKPRPIKHPVLRPAPRGTVSGTLVTLTPPLLTLTTATGTVTVTVTSATRIVRLFNGPSSLDELSPGDALVVRGTPDATGTIAATVIEDQSIQRADARLTGIIQSVGPATATVQVTADAQKRSPFGLGQIVSLQIGAATRIVSPTALSPQVFTGTAGLGVLAGAHVTVLGTYNRVQNAFTTVARIIIMKTPAVKPPAPQTVSGTLVALYGLTAPATLTLQTSKGVITVTVGTTPTVSIVRRYNGLSALDQLVPGDHLSLRGSFSDATTFAAVTIQDLSIQAADTIATLRVAGIIPSANTFSGTVVRDSNGARTPFDEGARVTVLVSAATKILVPAVAPATGEITGTLASLAPSQLVTVRGIYNRKLHTYTVTTLVRVHRA